MSLGAPVFPSPDAPNVVSLPPITGSAFDEPLPEQGWASAAAYISGSITPATPRFTNGLGNPLTMTFAFRDTAEGAPAMPNGAFGFSRLNESQIFAVLYTLQQFQDVANITLIRVQDPNSQYSNNAQFTFWNYTEVTPGSVADNAAGYGGSIYAGGVWQNSVFFNAQRSVATAPTPTNGGFELYMHEIGHALGLSHAGPYDLGDMSSYFAYARNAIFFNDSEQYSVMSYFNAETTHAFLGSVDASTPMLYDIAAMQRIYGANMNTRTGDNTYGFNANAGQAFYITGATQQANFAIWDAGGRDTLDFSGYDETQWINLNEEAFSSVGGLRNNISIARNVTIEDAFGGSGADSILGSAVANLLRGNAGADSIDGGVGNDTLEGGAGNDLYLSVTANDLITEVADNGADTIIATGSLSMPENIEVAIIAPGEVGITFNGGAAPEMILGNELRTIISGGGGDDTLSGFSGEDDIFGGDGNDLIVASIGARYLDGGAGDDVILAGNTSLADILALFAFP
jgi:serralysin